MRLTRPRTIVCIGRNYADHAAELGNPVPQKEPFYFLKPAGSFLHPGAGPILKPHSVILHYEVELAAVLGRAVDQLPNSPSVSYEAVKGWAVAIDMTARNYQESSKTAGLPWSLCKGFKTFLPVSHLIPKSQILDPSSRTTPVELWLKVNGKIRQSGHTNKMTFDIPRLLHHVTSVMPLDEDDLLLTGTPCGVGPVEVGDVITAGVSVNGVDLEEGRIEVAVQERIGGYGS